MLPWESLIARDARRPRRQAGLHPLEALEGRQLLAYSSLGYSLADLRVRGQAGSIATWGGTANVTITLQNIGASTINEPQSLAPPSEVTSGPDGNVVPPGYVTSSADGGPSQVGIYLSTSRRSLAGALKIGTATFASIPQNDVTQSTVSITLPQHPVGFPTTGVLYLRLVANEGGTVVESNTANNVSGAIPIRFIYRNAPALRATSLGLPSTLSPGDTVAPTIQITNIGSAAAAAGTVQVALVASTTPDFNLGSSIVGLYTVSSSIPGAYGNASSVAGFKHRRLFGSTLSSQNVNGSANTVTISGAAVTLPTSPATYYLGVVIDPNNQLNQLSLPTNRLEQIVRVGPSTSGLPPAGVVGSASTTSFPNPPDGELIGLVNTAAL
ncbi:hypothetical protein OJF2_13750 [Aquisphaera giovannonii]|uniref:CARDB domain-containing protein n=1 Tax=Aquisphaera giovannonii TaxID=406548 RepID=A0A5B9VZ12_9BACT|nr:hypothetical protein [Aquisphaera giovannonii]QEH32890.1 hypothetical protein OJF2_13750 [Aquisphaera giovannonii]